MASKISNPNLYLLSPVIQELQNQHPPNLAYLSRPIDSVIPLDHRVPSQLAVARLLQRRHVRMESYEAKNNARGALRLATRQIHPPNGRREEREGKRILHQMVPAFKRTYLPYRQRHPHLCEALVLGKLFRLHPQPRRGKSPRSRVELV